MRKLNLTFVALSVVALMFTASAAFAFHAVTISRPGPGDVVSSNVTVCMQAWGLEVEPAKNGVNEGKGHHHILVDVELPADLSQPVAKDASHIHMGDGSSCKTIQLSPGKHTIRTLFAKGNHVPYNPPFTDVIEVTVR